MKPGTLLNVLYGLLRKRLFQFIVATLFVTFTLLAIANVRKGISASLPRMEVLLTRF